MAGQQGTKAARTTCRPTAPHSASAIPLTILSALSSTLLSLLLLGCGEGPLTSLDQNRHQVAAQCGRAIADALPEYRPIVLSSPDGATLNPHSLLIEVARFGPEPLPLPLPLSKPEPELESEKSFLKSDRCLAVARRADLLLTLLDQGNQSGQSSFGATVRGIAATGADYHKQQDQQHQQRVQQQGVDRVRLRPLSTSPADFRRCGHPPMSYATGSAETSLNALVVWPYGASKAKTPNLKGLSFWLDGAALNRRLDQGLNQELNQGQQLIANARGCLFYPQKQGASRLRVHKAGKLVATRPLRVSRQELPPLPLILCPRSKSGQLQLALPGEPCQSGFISYCQLALTDRLRRPLGSWLQLLSARLSSTDCAVIQNKLNDGMTIPITGQPNVAADLEALRYGMPRLTALTVAVASGIGYLPAIAALESLTIILEDGQSTAQTFSEPQPNMNRLAVQGGSVQLSHLPLGQLRALTLDGVGLAGLDGIEKGQNLSYLDLSRNHIEDLTILPQLPKLAQLRLRANPVTDLSPLLIMPKLKDLDVGKNPRLDIEVLRQLTQLESLGLAENDLKDLGWLAGLTELRRLDVSYNAVTELSPLKVLGGLTALNADGNGLADISPIAELRRLQRLTLNGNLIRSVAPLRQLELLTTFQLDNNPLGRSVKKTTDNCPVNAASVAIREFCLR